VDLQNESPVVKFKVCSVYVTQLAVLTEYALHTKLNFTTGNSFW